MTLVLASVDARAETCGSMASFNAAADLQGLVATSGTLTFRMGGLPLAGVEKHHIAVLEDERTLNTAGNPCTAIDFKTWGDVALPQDVGTVKEELLNMCCLDCGTCGLERNGTAACETWAGPRPSPVIFTGPDQTCDLTISFTPQTFGYQVACTPGTTTGYTDTNRYGLAVTRVRIPVSGVATIQSEQFCYTASAQPGVDAGAPGPDAGASCSASDAIHAISLEPSSGRGDNQVFRAVYENCYGADGFRIVQLWVGDAVDLGVPHLQLGYEGGHLFLDGQSCVPGANATLTSAAGSLDCAATAVSKSGNRMTVDWALRFDVGSFAGTHKLFFDAKGPAGNPEPRLGWTQMGTFTVEATPHDAGGSTPPDASHQPDGSPAPADSGQAAEGPDAGAAASVDASRLPPNPDGACGCGAASPATLLPPVAALLAVWAAARRRRRGRGPPR